MATAAKGAGFQGKRIGAERVILDGGIFVDCAFDGSTLVYFGGKIPQLTNCQLNEVTFSFEGPAQNTVQLLRKLIAQKSITGI